MRLYPSHASSSSPLRARFRILFAFVSLLSTAGVAAAEDEALDTFSDVVDVEVIGIEVVVTDENGEPVVGLVPADFAVFEDGRRVEVTNFLAVEGREMRLLGTSGEGDMELVENATTGLNVVVFVDDLNIQPQNRNPILSALSDYLAAGFDERDRIMLVAHGDGTGVEVLVPFTNDIAALDAGIKTLQKRTGAGARIFLETRRALGAIHQAVLIDRPAPPSGAGPAAEPNDFEASVLQANQLADDMERIAQDRRAAVVSATAALEAFSDSLAGLPGRKAILYVSDGLHESPAESLFDAWQAKYRDWGLVNAVTEFGFGNRLRETEAQNYSTAPYFERLVRHAAGNKVAFYPIALSGRGSMGSLSAEFGGAGTPTGSGGQSVDYAATESASLETSLLRMADGTGGLAFTRSRNVADLFERIENDFTYYYSLGYSRTGDRDSEFHRVRVELVNRPGLEVRYSQGFKQRNPFELLEAQTLAALHHGMLDNPLGVRLTVLEVVPEGDAYRVVLMVEVPFSNLVLLPEEASHSGRVSLMAVARDQAGGVSRVQRIDLPIEVPNERILEVLESAAGYPLELRMGSGLHTLALGVRDFLGLQTSLLAKEIDPATTTPGGEPVATGETVGR